MGLFNLADYNIALTLKKYLGNRYLPIFCLLIAIINKAIIAYLYSDLEGDKSLYLLFASNFLEHKQFLEPVSFIENGQTYFRQNGAVVSPLYSFLAVPFLKITNSFSQTSLLIDILSWSVFFTGLYKVSKAIFNDVGIQCLLILCAGFFIYPHELQSTPKDTLSIGLLLWSVYVTVLFLNQRKINITLTVMLGLIYSAFALTKYLYMPLVVVFLLLLLFYSVIYKNKKLFLHSVFASVVNIGILWFVVFLLNRQQQTPHDFVLLQPPVKEFIKGFYPNNLLSFFPFISSSFINVNFWGVQLESIFKTTYSKVSTAFNFIDLVLLSFLLAGLGWIRNQIDRDKRQIFFIMVTISVAILGMLVYMSVSFKGVQYVGQQDLWTYVSEPRSYLFIIVFLQLLLFYLITKTNLNQLFKNFLFLLFIIECAHGLYFTVKQSMQADVIQKEIIERSSNKNIVAYANYLKAKNAGAQIKLITNDNHLRWLSNLHAINSFTFSDNTNCNTYSFTPNTVLLFATYEEQPFPAQKCLDAFELLDIKNLPPYNIKVYKIQ